VTMDDPSGGIFEEIGLDWSRIAGDIAAAEAEINRLMPRLRAAASARATLAFGTTGYQQATADIGRFQAALRGLEASSGSALARQQAIARLQRQITATERQAGAATSQQAQERLRSLRAEQQALREVGQLRERQARAAPQRDPTTGRFLPRATTAAVPPAGQSPAPPPPPRPPLALPPPQRTAFVIPPGTPPVGPIPLGPATPPRVPPFRVAATPASTNLVTPHLPLIQQHLRANEARLGALEALQQAATDPAAIARLEGQLRQAREQQRHLESVRGLGEADRRSQPATAARRAAEALELVDPANLRFDPNIDRYVTARGRIVSLREAERSLAQQIVSIDGRQVRITEANAAAHERQARAINVQEERARLLQSRFADAGRSAVQLEDALRQQEAAQARVGSPDRLRQLREGPRGAVAFDADAGRFRDRAGAFFDEDILRQRQAVRQVRLPGGVSAGAPRTRAEEQRILAEARALGQLNRQVDAFQRKVDEAAGVRRGGLARLFGNPGDLVRLIGSFVGLNVGLSVATTVGNALNATISRGIDLERERARLVRSVAAAYREASPQVEAFARAQAATPGGLSGNEVRAAALNVRTLIANYQFTQSQTETLIQRTRDLTAVYGGDFLDNIQRVQSAMRGEAESAETLGLTLNATAVAARAQGGAFKDVYERLSDTTRAQIIYREFLRQTANLQGQASASARDFDGRLRDLAKSWDTFTGRAGTAFATVLEGPLQAAKEALDTISRVLKEIEDREAAIRALRSGQQAPTTAPSGGTPPGTTPPATGAPSPPARVVLPAGAGTDRTAVARRAAEAFEAEAAAERAVIDAQRALDEALARRNTAPRSLDTRGPTDAEVAAARERLEEQRRLLAEARAVANAQAALARQAPQGARATGDLSEAIGDRPIRDAERFNARFAEFARERQRLQRELGTLTEQREIALLDGLDDGALVRRIGEVTEALVQLGLEQRRLSLAPAPEADRLLAREQARIRNAAPTTQEAPAPGRVGVAAVERLDEEGRAAATRQRVAMDVEGNRVRQATERAESAIERSKKAQAEATAAQARREAELEAIARNRAELERIIAERRQQAESALPTDEQGGIRVATPEQIRESAEARVRAQESERIRRETRPPLPPLIPIPPDDPTEAQADAYERLVATIRSRIAAEEEVLRVQQRQAEIAHQLAAVEREATLIQLASRARANEASVRIADARLEVLQAEERMAPLQEAQAAAQERAADAQERLRDVQRENLDLTERRLRAEQAALGIQQQAAQTNERIQHLQLALAAQRAARRLGQEDPTGGLNRAEARREIRQLGRQSTVEQFQQFEAEAPIRAIQREQDRDQINRGIAAIPLQREADEAERAAARAAAEAKAHQSVIDAATARIRAEERVLEIANLRDARALQAIDRDRIHWQTEDTLAAGVLEKAKEAAAAWERAAGDATTAANNAPRPAGGTTAPTGPTPVARPGEGGALDVDNPLGPPPPPPGVPPSFPVDAPTPTYPLTRDAVAAGVRPPGVPASARLIPATGSTPAYWWDGRTGRAWLTDGTPVDPRALHPTTPIPTNVPLAGRAVTNGRGPQGVYGPPLPPPPAPTPAPVPVPPPPVQAAATGAHAVGRGGLTVNGPLMDLRGVTVGVSRRDLEALRDEGHQQWDDTINALLTGLETGDFGAPSGVGGRVNE
jgi:DNA repair exonuclease SbcCD ATPase subunit